MLVYISHLISNINRRARPTQLFPKPSLFHPVSYLPGSRAAGVTHVPQYLASPYHDGAEVAGQLSFILVSSASRC